MAATTMGSNGQSTLSSPASSRRLPQLVPQTNHVASTGELIVNNDTYASGSLSDDGDPNAPAKAEFMISFLVDARGGSMHGCRFSGVRVSVVDSVYHVSFPKVLSVL